MWLNHFKVFFSLSVCNKMSENRGAIVDGDFRFDCHSDGDLTASAASATVNVTAAITRTAAKGNAKANRTHSHTHTHTHTCALHVCVRCFVAVTEMDAMSDVWGNVRVAVTAMPRKCVCVYFPYALQNHICGLLVGRLFKTIKLYWHLKE